MTGKSSLRAGRRSCQIFIALLFIVIPVLNRSDYSHVYGNYLSFHLFGIPLADPLAILQLTAKNLYLTLDNLVGILLPVMLAFFLGTVFCSWLCVYGLFSEWIHRLRHKIVKRKTADATLPGTVPGTRQRTGEHGNGFFVKLTVFTAGFVAFFLFSTTPVLNQLSTAAWYSRFFQYLFGQDVVSLGIFFPLGLLGLEFLTGKRLWCRFVCPQSVLIVLIRQLNRNRLQVAFQQEKCICRAGHERCDKACTLSLLPRTVNRTPELECNNCGDCVVACRKMGRALAFESPFASAAPVMARIRHSFSIPVRFRRPLLLAVAIVASGILLATLLHRRPPASRHNVPVAQAVLSRYADETYVLDITLPDPKGEIKKILSAGEAITTQVMLSNAKVWRLNPPAMVSVGRPPALPVKTMLTLLYHEGDRRTITLTTSTINDRAGTAYEDPWF